MTAAPQETSDYERLMKRLERAVRDLEDAASAADDAAEDARDAVESIRSGGMADDDPDTVYELPGFVARWHDDDHDGPMAWCQHPVCRVAHPLTSRAVAT